MVTAHENGAASSDAILYGAPSDIAPDYKQQYLRMLIQEWVDLDQRRAEVIDRFWQLLEEDQLPRGRNENDAEAGMFGEEMLRVFSWRVWEHDPARISLHLHHQLLSALAFAPGLCPLTEQNLDVWKDSIHLYLYRHLSRNALPGARALLEQLQDEGILKLRQVPELVLIGIGSEALDNTLHYADKDPGKTLCGRKIHRGTDCDTFDAVSTAGDGSPRLCRSRSEDQDDQVEMTKADCRHCLRLIHTDSFQNVGLIKLDAARQLDLMAHPLATSVTEILLDQLRATGQKRRNLKEASDQLETALWRQCLPLLLLEEPLDAGTRDQLRNAHRRVSLFTYTQQVDGRW